MPPGTHGPAGQSERGFFLFDWQVVSARKRGVVIPAGKPESSAMEGTLDGIKVYLEHENVVIYLWMKPFWLQTRGAWGLEDPVQARRGQSCRTPGAAP